mgnify:FL=1
MTHVGVGVVEGQLIENLHVLNAQRLVALDDAISKMQTDGK